jgi:hypothetical protein
MFVLAHAPVWRLARDTEDIKPCESCLGDEEMWNDAACIAKHDALKVGVWCVKIREIRIPLAAKSAGTRSRQLRSLSALHEPPDGNNNFMLLRIAKRDMVSPRYQGQEM